MKMRQIDQAHYAIAAAFLIGGVSIGFLCIMTALITVGGIMHKY